MSIWKEQGFQKVHNDRYQDPITRTLQLLHISVTAFSQTDLFLVWIYFELDPHRNLSEQLQSQARTNVDMSTWSNRDKA